MLIKLSSKPTGGLGNRLFTYNFLRQLAGAVNCNYSHPHLKDAQFFKNMGLRFSCQLNFKSWYVNQDDLNEICREDFYAKIIQKNNFCLILDPPFLGDTFFEYTVRAPSSYISLKPNYQVIPLWRKHTSKCIGVHFRGGDFFSWNPEAVLPASYYVDAIRKIINGIGNSKFKILLFTDDLTLEAYRFVLNEFKDYCIVNEPNHSSDVADFFSLSLCDYIVSSPSTFCIWAGILAPECRIIHSVNWLQGQANKKDKFWSQLLNGGNDYYRLWTAI